MLHNFGISSEMNKAMAVSILLIWPGIEVNNLFESLVAQVHVGHMIGAV
jgi:hypothetical protein